ncbi:relaxase/mobilization nuclease domain-containing protein [Desulfomicrobium baculatum]|uniref:MobA/VirD2-like nuclease domain-containing protein n=1 Tax=Desulfomicrobium baculatum (strain DSM 4028 / VKM B-1378 / X) TaxID=525897 RepID=C7LNI1_DESBD|nr:relaxase/mobilization nuclease domain-containing protein [Desulfomicrobium baculatum]ACU88866.1 hypothetical protein Dbac_0745 [Desulfomicrobium baculatum DSM 4028]
MSSVACAEGNPSKSFCPEDEAKLTLKYFLATESEFAHALGYGDHQRLCGVHKNTRQMHLHGAYNMIHPEKLTRYEPYRDYHKRDKVCRELERRFDPGRVPYEKFTQGNPYVWMALTWGGLQSELNMGVLGARPLDGERNQGAASGGAGKKKGFG